MTEHFKVGYFVGSLAKGSINRILSKALVRVAPANLEFTEIPIKDLPLSRTSLEGALRGPGSSL